MTTKQLDPTLYTKKGTLRKRKPKKNKNYLNKFYFVSCAIKLIKRINVQEKISSR